MRLELPFDILLPVSATILVAGMGGGFDVFCGLPIYFELRQRGYTVYLANLSFSALKEYSDGEWLSATLVGVGAADVELSGYYPERFLARWFRESQGEEVPLWCFDAAGAVALLEDYRRLVQRLQIDAIILVDGGVDSPARGDEELCGTILEDYLSIAAVSQLQEVPVSDRSLRIRSDPAVSEQRARFTRQCVTTSARIRFLLGTLSLRIYGVIYR